MKITVNEGLPIKGKPFPKLMRCTVTEDIVLFAHERLGCVLVPGKKAQHAIGYPSRNWDMDVFEDFHGSITIEND